MTETNLFRCYARDYATMPSALGTGMSCPILGASYDKAHLKFQASKEPAADAPALFVMRIKGEFTEYPCPSNIDQIVSEMRDCFAAQGLTDVGEPKICWRAKPNDMWEEDEHIPLGEHDTYREIMESKSHQVVGGEALIAFEIPAEQRSKLPAVEKAIDGLIAERLSQRKAALG